MRKKKILFLLHIPPPIHGSSIVGETIYKSKKINNFFQCEYVNLILSRKVIETGKIGLFKLIRVPKIMMRLFFKLIFFKPEICYFALTASGGAFFKDVVFISLIRLFKVQIIYHLHNKGYSKFSNLKIYNYLYRFVFYKSKVILLSQLLYSDIEKYVDIENIYICPNGVGDILDNTQSLVIQNKDINKPIQILFLSNLIISKGVFVLLDALEILHKQQINFNCNFIGGEGDINYDVLIEYIKEKGLINNVKYLGKKVGKEKTIFLSNSDIFVLPTFYNNECFPLVLLEAMQFYLPIISTSEGGISDIVEHETTGFIVPQKNAVALSEKIAILINDSELRTKMGIAGRQKYESHFNLIKFEDRIIEILN